MELGGPRRKSRGGVTRLGYGKGMMQQLKELDAVFFCADCNANGKDRRVTLWVADTCGLRLRRPLARAGKTPQESAAPHPPFPPRTAKEALNKRAETAGAAARLVTPNAETPTQKHCAAVKRDGFHVAKRRASCQFCALCAPLPANAHLFSNSRRRKSIAWVQSSLGRSRTDEKRRMRSTRDS